MASDIFHFKQFDIRQDQCAMKVGTDGVLLGALAPIAMGGQQASHRLLDIGTGTGLVALMMAQRLAETGIESFRIDAVEIDPQAAAQARANFEASRWSDKLQVHGCALQDFTPQWEMVEKAERVEKVERVEKAERTVLYDLIVSNPPFYNGTLKPDDEARAVARHKDSLPLRCIMAFAREHLSDEGTLTLIYPNDYDSEVMTEAILAGLHSRHIHRICTQTGKPCKRLVVTFGKRVAATQTDTLSLRNERSEYSDTYRQLTEAFYTSLK